MMVTMVSVGLVTMVSVVLVRGSNGDNGEYRDGEGQ